MQVRASDVRVSERVCMSSITLERYATVYNDLIEEVSIVLHYTLKILLPRETEATLMCLSIGTPKNNKFSIWSKWKIHYF